MAVVRLEAAMKLTRPKSVFALSVALAAIGVASPQALGARNEAAGARAQDAATAQMLQRYRAASDPRQAQRVFEEIRKAAEQSPQAAYLCGVLAAPAGSVVHDSALASRCLERAAREGIPEAQHRLAAAILEMDKESKQRADAERWLSAAARSLPESVYLLALVKASEHPDPARARRDVVLKAAQANYPPAQYDLARTLFAEGDKVQSRSWLDKAAGQGHAEAAVELALQLEGDKRDADIPRIVELLEQASMRGSSRANYALGMRLMQANGVKRDTERAFALFQRDAATGHAASQYALGFMLMQGVGTGADEAAAVEWFRRAAAQGHAEAMYGLGNAYANGWGVGKSMDLAYQWYCKSAQAGSEGGRQLVGRDKSVDCPLPDRR